MTMKNPQTLNISRLLTLLLGAALLLGGSPSQLARAQTPSTLEQLLQQAGEQSPMLRAMHAESEARRQQIRMARAWEDPMLGIEWRDIDSGQPTLAPTAVGSMRYSLRQTLPRFGERALKTKIAEGGLHQALAETDDSRSNLFADIRRSWADAWQAEEAQRINEQLQHLLAQMEAASRQRYSLGMGSQADVIRLQSELSMLRSEKLQWQSALQRARARLAALLGLPATQLPTSDFALPALAPLPGASQWMQRMEAGNARLQQLRHEVQTAGAQQELAALNGQPRVTLGAAAIQMERRVPMVEVMLELQLPLQQGVLRAERDEAGAMKLRAQARVQAQLQMLEGEVNAMLAMHAGARAQQDLLEGTLQPQAELALQTALASYQAGRGEFAMLLEAQQQLRRLRQMRLMTQFEQFQAWIGLQQLAGE